MLSQLTWYSLLLLFQTTKQESLLSSEDIANLKTIFGKPQCNVAQMNSVYLTPSEFRGRWWGVLGTDEINQGTTSYLLDIYQDEIPSLVINREVANSKGFCFEAYYSSQDVFLNGQHFWQQTQNYTVEPQVLRWAQAGRTYSTLMKILWKNDNLMVQYACMSPSADGTCPQNFALLFVNSRRQSVLDESEAEALNILLEYSCLPKTRQFTKYNPSEPCVADYETRTSMYYVREGCDYTNIKWIEQHTTEASYETLVANPAWMGVNGEWFGQVTVLEYREPYASQNKLYVPMYRQESSSSSSCDVIGTTAWSVNDTAKDIPGFFPTKNLWVQTGGVANNVSDPTNILFWRIAHDGVIASTISCGGAVPCKDATNAFAGGSRRYRKRSELIFKIRLYPAIALACIDPSVIKTCPGIRLPQCTVKHVSGIKIATLVCRVKCNMRNLVTCGAHFDPKTCLTSDVPKLTYSDADISLFSGTWVANYFLYNYPWTSLTCKVQSSKSGFQMTCSYRSLGICQGPMNISAVQQGSNGGSLVWTFNDATLGPYKENIYIIWQTPNVVAFYGCAFNGQDTDGSCRDDRMIAMVFTNKNHVLSNAEMQSVSAAFDSVCLFTESQLFSLNTQDDCLTNPNS